MAVYPQAPSLDRPRDLGRPTFGRGVDGWLAAALGRRLDGLPIRLRFWNGLELTVSHGAPCATLVLKDRRTVVELLRNPEIGFGEGFSAGRIDVQGDLVALLEGVYRAIEERGAWRPGPLQRWLAHRPNTLRASRHNVHRHYDLGNDFYRLWLDEEMVYTCAYFASPEHTLEEAQIAKMDLVCRKLRLEPGERVVEAGCGWGSLALHMARRYGTRVTAFNISREQIRHARDRARAEGLNHLVEFVEDDYRTISGRFDVFVSVGMLEHVGLRQFRTFGEVIDRAIAPVDGRGLLHFIGRTRPRPLSAWIRKRIFPGGYPPALGEVFAHVLQPWNFSVLDVENLRLHYAMTLEHWLARFDRARDRVVASFDERFERAWRLYLAGSQAAFTTGSMQLFQVAFARGRSNAVPWTRPV
jgi:cyclopropane-fatty-acyl-phospholipid synthase